MQQSVIDNIHAYVHSHAFTPLSKLVKIEREWTEFQTKVLLY